MKGKEAIPIAMNDSVTIKGGRTQSEGDVSKKTRRNRQKNGLTHEENLLRKWMTRFGLCYATL